jgi:hypothetical protein
MFSFQEIYHRVMVSVYPFALDNMALKELIQKQERSIKKLRAYKLKSTFPGKE